MDNRSEKIGYKIRQAQLEKIPYFFIVGDKEVDDKTVSLRSRKDGDLGASPLDSVIDRIVKMHSRPGDVLLDFFAGSGTLGESARALGRSAILVDSNPDAIRVMRRRFAGLGAKWIGCGTIAE